VPKRYDGSEGAARELCLKVCAWMGIPDDRIRFSFRMEEIRTAGRSAAAHRLHAEHPGLVAVSGLKATMTAAEVAELAAAGFAAEIDVLTERELQAELERCTAISSERDPQRRTELLSRAHQVWSTTAGSDSRAAWIDLRGSGHQGTAVLLSATALTDPATVVAATAHELGHEVLWGYHLVDSSRPDAEGLADLFAVFHGFGIFLANQAVERVPSRMVARVAGRSTLQRLGYLGERGASDALAAYLFRRHLLWPASILPSMPPELDRAVRIRTFARLASLVKQDEVAAIQAGAPLP
jgi:hypothetical protein